MVLIGLLLSLVGLAICFRGVYIGKVLKAIMGAIQGAIYALFIRIILSLFGVYTTNLFTLILITLIAIMAYLYTMREELYRKIQGLINALVVGGIVVVVVYGLLRVYLLYSGSFSFDTTSNSLPLIAALCIIALFAAMGIKWYKGFRKVWSFFIAMVASLIILCMYIELLPALVVACIVSAITMYLLVTYDKYIEYMKISAIGAALSVVGVVIIVGGSYMLMGIADMVVSNIANLISNSRVYSNYESELILSLIGFVVLTVAGTISQYRFVLSHNGASKNNVPDFEAIKNSMNQTGEVVGGYADKAAKKISKKIKHVKKAIRKNRAAIEKAFKICLCSLVGISLIVGAVYGGKALIGGIKKHGQEKTIETNADRYANSINSIFGDEIITISDSSYVGESGDGIDSTMMGHISGVISGDLTAAGITDPETKEWYPDYVTTRINVNYEETDRIAKLFAAVIESYFGVDANECTSPIHDILEYGDFSPGEYNITPWLTVDLGGRSNIEALISLTDDYSVWQMDCSYRF